MCTRVLFQIINRPADGGITALHMAALNGHIESIQLLLDLGASVSKVTVQDGATIDLIGNLTHYLSTCLRKSTELYCNFGTRSCI